MAYEVQNPRLSFSDGSRAFAGDVLTEDELLEKCKYKYVLKNLLDRGHVILLEDEGEDPADEGEDD